VLAQHFFWGGGLGKTTESLGEDGQSGLFEARISKIRKQKFPSLNCGIWCSIVTGVCLTSKHVDVGLFIHNSVRVKFVMAVTMMITLSGSLVCAV